MANIREVVLDFLSSDWKLIFSSFKDSVVVTFRYFYALQDFIFRKKSYSESTSFKDDLWAKVQVFSLSLIFKLWEHEHYRSPSFQQDMIDNLRNVAVPGTGLPLSLFCYNWWACLSFVFFVNPVICILGAMNKAFKVQKQRVTEKKGSGRFSFEDFVVTSLRFYRDHLLHPDDWFSFWRLNSRLVSYHSYVTKADGYKQEDKWTFLIDGKRLQVPISPFIEDLSAIVCKNKNIEGGMGIHFFKNAAHGGDWILQEKLENAAWLNELLPPESPLSTMRVITTSSWYVDENKGGDNANKYIKALSAVLRLGRAGAMTDHSSVLFNVDVSTGAIKEGMTNAHWYQLGLRKAFSCSWLPQEGFSKHPDAPHPQVTGRFIPGMKEALDIVINAHFKMMKDVPIVGWDVAFTTKGVVLLEVNLSCNFFRGSFDVPSYIAFVDSYWSKVESAEKKSSKSTGSSTAASASTSAAASAAAPAAANIRDDGKPLKQQ